MTIADAGFLGILALAVGLLGLSLWGALGIIDRHLHRQRVRRDWEERHHRGDNCS